MSYDDTVRYLYSLQKYGIKFGLENISRLASEFGNPQESFLSVHVAGTNGKGSTSAIIATILQTFGFRVGLFTSPHLISFTERIRVDGREISENEVISLAGEIRDISSRIKDFSPTFFEVVTALALLYFRRKSVDIAVMETGMGGRLDATNIVLPAVSVITSISYDHREFLGSTLREIAREKAGIIKNGIPVVISHQESEAKEVIERVAEEEESELYTYGRDFSSGLRHENMTGIHFDYRDDRVLIEDIFLPLAGGHQMQNASVAIKAVQQFYKRTQHSTPDIQLIKNGMTSIKWPGRLEFINDSPPVLIDAAHNPAASLTLSKVLKDVFFKDYPRIILILGIMGDKDIEGIMEPLLPLASEIILTAPAYGRAASPGRLADIAASMGFPNVQKVPTVKEALHVALAVAEEKRNQNVCPRPLAPCLLPLILITGSFYTIGEAKEVLGQKGVLTRLRE